MTIPVGARLIDGEETVRSRPMKVLALGMSRTGTSCKSGDLDESLE